MKRAPPPLTTTAFVWMRETLDPRRPIRRRATAVSALVLLFVMPAFATAVLAPEQNGPAYTESFSFDPGWHVSHRMDWQGGVYAFGFGVSAQIQYSLFAGVSTPLCLQITRPEWLVPDDSFNVSIVAAGESGGRAGFFFDSGLKVTLSVPGQSWDVIDLQKTVDLCAEYTTPIGECLTDEFEARVPLGEVTAPIIDYSIELFVGARAHIRFVTQLESKLVMSGSSLVECVDRDLSWKYNGETISQSMTTKASARTPVSMTLAHTRLILKGLSLVVTDFFLELDAPGFDPVFLTIGLPDIVFPVIGSDEAPPSHFLPQTDVPDRLANIEIGTVEIPVLFTQTNTDGTARIYSPPVVIAVVLLGLVGMAALKGVCSHD